MNEYPKKRDLDRIYFRAERDECEATTVSAYDLLSDEDRKAIAWVREHGGLDAVEKRLMPEGMEWPRFEDGEPVRIGDEISWRDEGGVVNSIELQDGGYYVLHAADGAEDWIHPQYFPGERVKRPTVLAADGEPLEVGQTVYAPHYDYVRCTVLSFELAVDGWLVEVENEGGHKFRQTPDEFIHQRPVLDADGVLCREGDEVWEVRSHRRREIVGTNYCDHRTGEPLILCDGDDAVPIPATCVTHAKPEPPDSWERLERELADEMCSQQCGPISPEKAVDAASAYVLRARALAERGE